MKRTRFAVAIAVVCVACVKVPDSIKGTFADRQNGETDNFSPSAPHSFAPADPVLTQAVLAVVDASTADARASSSSVEGMCPRDVNASSVADAGATISTASNCLQDAGNP
jgi:hypothetical protein